MKKIKRGIDGEDYIYRNDQGTEIKTYKEDLEWIIRVVIEPLRDFLNMEFEEDDSQKMVYIARALLERAEEKIYEATEYIDKNYGRVEIVRASHCQPEKTISIKPELMLDIVFTPSKDPVVVKLSGRSSERKAASKS